MKIVTIHTAKTTLSQLLARVENPIAKLVPFQPRPIKRQFGALRGIVSVGPEFFDSLPEEELSGWE